MAVYLPLKTNKRPAISGWADDSYECSRDEALRSSEWVGLRCDGLVVIDCDSEDAAARWVSLVLEKDDGREELAQTTVVKTPRGYHFMYAATEGSPTGPAVGVMPDIDIRAGQGSYVVCPPTPGYQLVKLA